MIKHISHKLQDKLAPTLVDVIDTSAAHKGHMESVEGQLTHIRIMLSGGGVTSLSRLALHRKIYAILAEELASGLHAVEIRVENTHL